MGDSRDSRVDGTDRDADELLADHISGADELTTEQLESLRYNRSPYDYPGEGDGYPPLDEDDAASGWADAPTKGVDRDTLIELIYQPFAAKLDAPWEDAADSILARWLVLDPADEALVERIAKRIAWRSWHGFHNTEADFPNGMVTQDQLWAQFVPRMQASWMDEARAVLAVLAPNLPGGSE